MALAGATVTLTGPNGTTTVTTGTHGLYRFEGRGEGTYTVTVTPPVGYTASPSIQGGDPTKDKNGSPATVTLIGDAATDLTIDFGYYEPRPEIRLWTDGKENA